MKLFASIATTVAITGAVWGLVLFQPALAESPKAPQVEEQLKPTHNALTGNEHYLRGVTKTISLKAMPALLEEFEDSYIQTGKLPENFDRIIILYQEFNASFTEAKVTIGFNVAKSPLANDQIKLPPMDRTELLLKRGDHSESELTKAWEEINFQKSVKAVIEIHFLESRGEPESSQLSVYYQ